MRLYLRPLMGMWRREVITYLREHSRVISSIVSPVMWIAIVGIGIDRGLRPDLPGGISYLDFLVPGIVAQAVMFSTIFYGLYIVWDRKMDVLKAVLVTPVPRPVVFFGKVLGGATQAVLEGLVMLVISALFISYFWWNAPLLVGIIVLTAVLFTSLGLALGSFFESFEGFRLTSSFLAFPMFFLSGALFPIDDLPALLTWFVVVNPLTYSVDALRGLMVGVHEYPYALSVSVLAGFTVVMVMVGAWSFNRMKQ